MDFVAWGVRGFSRPICGDATIVTQRRKWTEKDSWSIWRVQVIARNAASQKADNSSFDVAHAAPSFA